MNLTIFLHHNIIFDFTPNWFDWLSLLLTIASIIGAYWVAKTMYDQEKLDNLKENKELQKSENQILTNNLEQLKKAIAKQLTSLEEYQKNDGFKLEFYPSVQVDFLQFIGVKEIYKKYGFNDQGKIDTLNDLLVNLYSLFDFRNSLRSEIRTHIEKYNYHEQKLYKYRELLYTHYFSLCNMRAINVSQIEGGKTWTFHEKDKFMAEYSELRKNTFNNPEIIENNGLKDRNKLISEFIQPLIQTSIKYIPEDHNAIETNDLANEVNSAFIDIKYISEKHSNAIQSHIEILKAVDGAIEKFKEIK